MDGPDKPKVVLTFAVYQGDQLLRRETIAQEIVKIGRDTRSHLLVDDALASRMHAVIEVASPADLTIIDLGNLPGTLVNCERVSKCKVRPGDQIQIGSTLVVLERAEFAIYAVPAMSGTIENAPATEALQDGGYTYSMLRTGLGVSLDEVESHLSAIEVIVLWGSTIVRVAHLTPPRPFYVGEELGCDCFIPVEVLGATRAPLIVSVKQRASLVILPRSRGYVDIPAHGRVDLADLISSGRAAPSSEMSGAYEYELPPDAKARMELERSIVFEVGAVHAGKRVPPGLLASTDAEALLYAGLSFLLHAGMVAAFAFFMPGMRGDDGDALNRDQILRMQKLLNAAAERESEQRDPQEVAENQTNREGGTGASALGESGAMGTSATGESAHKYGVQGPKENPDPHLAKIAALQEAAQFGMIGVLATMAGGGPKAPTAPWGRDESLGNDSRSALGGIFGGTTDDSFGTGGLNLTGTGEGSGGPGEGIGVLNFGNLDHGGGGGTGQGIGVGIGHPGRGHTAIAPHIHELTASINGRLPAEVIQRIVRQNFGRFRYCFEKGAQNSPDLQGRVTVKFVIDRSGAVALSADGGSDLPDQGVVRCVVAGFGNLSFPRPEGGMVTVVYPIVFNSGQ